MWHLIAAAESNTLVSSSMDASKTHRCFRMSRQTKNSTPTACYFEFDIRMGQVGREHVLRVW